MYVLTYVSKWRNSDLQWWKYLVLARWITLSINAWTLWGWKDQGSAIQFLYICNYWIGKDPMIVFMTNTSKKNKNIVPGKGIFLQAHEPSLMPNMKRASLSRKGLSCSLLLYSYMTFCLQVNQSWIFTVLLYLFKELISMQTNVDASSTLVVMQAVNFSMRIMITTRWGCHACWNDDHHPRSHLLLLLLLLSFSYWFPPSQ